MTRRVATAVEYLLLGGAAAAFVTLLSGTTSPLHPWFGGDSAMFRLIGTAMAHGQVLYVDIWDHKGPGLFLIQWLGQVLVPGRLGLYLIQIALLWATLVLLFETARRLAPAPVAWSAVLVALAFLAPAYEHGNLSEEFSLPFIALVFFLLTREWAGAGRVPTWQFAAAGAAFAYVVFIRINNALPIFAVFLAYFLWAVIVRRPFVRALLTSLAGFAAVCAAFVVGFAAIGALPQMLDGTFLFSMRYTENASISADRMFVNGYVYLAIIAVVAPVAGGIADAQSRGRRTFLLLGWLLSGSTAVALLLSSTGYFHYLQIGVPGIALAVALGFGAARGSVRWHVLAVAVIVAVAAIGSAAQREGAAQRRADEPAYTAKVEDILSSVPVAERGEVYGWNVDARFYLNAGTLPLHRFFTMQEWWGTSDPSVTDEAIAFVEDDEPEWIVATTVGDERLRGILDAQYTQVAQNETFTLYEREAPAS